MVKLLNRSMEIGIQCKMCSYHDNTWLVKSKLNLEDYNLANKNGQQHNTAYILGNKGELSISDTRHKHA
jgi:hypothetical protein